MKVLGHEISAEVEAACIEGMKSCKFFTAANVAATAERVGRMARHSDVAYRFADRLIQRERKAGNIKRRGRGWVWK